MTNHKSPYDRQYDLTNCDAEPLHRIRLIQPSAMLLAIDKRDFSIKYVSDNFCRQFDRSPEECLALNLEAFLTDATLETLRKHLVNVDQLSDNLIHVTEWRHGRNADWQNMLVRVTENHIVLEFEARSSEFLQLDFLRKIDHSIMHLQSLTDQEDVFCETAKVVKQITGYDRVMIYRFDEHYNGDVIAEECEKHHTSYLNLRYPHTDIPKQARELYLINQIRQIATTAIDRQVYLHRSTDAADLDLSLASNRGVSRFHLQYLNNIGVGASLSAAIILNNKLWGLIACHHDTEKVLDSRVRSMINFFCRMITSHLMMRETNTFRGRILQTQLHRSKLFEQMSKDYDVLGGLLATEQTLLELPAATGCILVFDRQIHTVGDVPNEQEIDRLLEFLREQEYNLLASSDFFTVLPEARGWQYAPAGILSVRISRNPGEYIVWVRPEIVSTVVWGGNPAERKFIIDDRVNLNPEMSFAKWEEQVRGQSEPWEQYQEDAALALRNDIKEVIIQKYQQVRALNDELTTAYADLETFSYTVSHDLRAPLRTIKGFAEILGEDYGDKLDEDGHRVLGTIMSSVGKMNQFINDILSFSRAGGKELHIQLVDLRLIVEEAWRSLGPDIEQATLKLPDTMPSVPADTKLLRQVFVNLLGNAVKYSSVNQRAVIEVSAHRENGRTLVVVKDNGIGFEEKYAEHIFGVFHRLVLADEYEGTGIGLAIVKKIMESHGGEVTARSVPGEGATFMLSFDENLVVSPN